MHRRKRLNPVIAQAASVAIPAAAWALTALFLRHPVYRAFHRLASLAYQLGLRLSDAAANVPSESAQTWQTWASQQPQSPATIPREPSEERGAVDRINDILTSVSKEMSRPRAVAATVGVQMLATAVVLGAAQAALSGIAAYWVYRWFDSRRLLRIR